MELGGKPLGVLFETRTYRVMREDGKYNIFRRKTDEFGGVFWERLTPIAVNKNGNGLVEMIDLSVVTELIEFIARRVD